MDIFMVISLFVIFLILFSICGWCCRRKREGTVYGYGPNVTVSTQPIQSSGVVVPPYPIDARHPTPQMTGPPAPGFATHTAPYPTHSPYPQPVPTYYPSPMGMSPYPPTSGAPYPPAGGAPYPPAGGAPYPPASGAGDYNSHPPPYDVAVSSPPVQPMPVKEAYGKQSPYNPHFS